MKAAKKNISTSPALEYAEAVVAGAVVAGPHVRNACRRHIDDLQRTDGIWFDADAESRVIGFFENILKLSDGQFAGQKFILQPSQKFILGSLFGWQRADGSRRFRRAFIEEGKGNGKTPLAAGIGLYGFLSCGESGAEIYSVASKKDQARIMYRDAVRMVRQSPALLKRVEFSGGEGREYNMAHMPTGSFFRCLSRDTGKSGSGPRPYFVLADEIHEMTDRGVLETMERGFKSRREPLLLMITNAGTDRNSIAYEEHAHAVRVAAGNPDAETDSTYLGQIIDDSSFSFVCSLDPGDDPLADKSCWKKANPLLGTTITEQYLEQVVAQAKAIPGQLNGILRLHFCEWTDAAQAWMSRESFEPVLADFTPALKQKVYVGLDLSQNRDLTALAMVQHTGDRNGKPCFDAWVEVWTPGDSLAARTIRDKQPYDLWVAAGFLHKIPGDSINMRDIAQSVFNLHTDYGIATIAYDRYSFRRFEGEINEMGLSLNFIEHPQGGTKRGKPHDGMTEGLWMPGSLRLLEELILEKRIRIKRNPVLISAIMSAVIETDRWDNSWLSKQRATNKIDAAVALCMAVGAAMGSSQKRRSIYETRGVLVV